MTQLNPLRSRDPDLNKLHLTYEVFRNFEPLAIGIGGQAGLAVMAAETGMTPERVKAALGSHVTTYQYRFNMREGKARVGLDGQPHGEPVTKEQSNFAHACLKKRKERLNKAKLGKSGRPILKLNMSGASR